MYLSAGVLADYLEYAILTLVFQGITLGEKTGQAYWEYDTGKYCPATLYSPPLCPFTGLLAQKSLTII